MFSLRECGLDLKPHEIRVLLDSVAEVVWTHYRQEHITLANGVGDDSAKISPERNVVDIAKNSIFSKAASQAIIYTAGDR